MIVAAPAAAADGAVLGVAPTAPPRVGTRNTAGRVAHARRSGGSPRRAAPAWRFFLAAGLADVAATAGTVILSWYVAALIVAGVVAGGLAVPWPAPATPGLRRPRRGGGGFLRAAGAFAADRLAAAGAGWRRGQCPLTRSGRARSSVIPPMSR